MSKERTEIEKILGIHAGSADVYVKCGLTEPPHPRLRPVYLLYLAVGRPCEAKTATAYGAYHPMTSSRGGGFVFMYAGGKSEGIPWEVPMWAVGVAIEITQIVRDAENIGYEAGYESGLSSGKSFVKRLANGEIGSDFFEVADGRDHIRLHRKKW